MCVLVLQVILTQLHTREDIDEGRVFEAIASIHVSDEHFNEVLKIESLKLRRSNSEKTLHIATQYDFFERGRGMKGGGRGEEGDTRNKIVNDFSMVVSQT
jgi:hypothetical protein